jgi:hypothetical protein
MAMVVPG